MLLPEGLGWLRPHLDELRGTYQQLRRSHDPIPAFERALADTLSESDYDRVESFFDGEHDAVYGPDAGAQARDHLRDLLEAQPGESSTPTVDSVPAATGEVTSIDDFYDENPQRRTSQELKFGDRWSIGGQYRRWELFWVIDTGELAALGPDLRAPDDDDPLAATLEAVEELVLRVGPATHAAPNVIEVLCIERDQTALEQLLGDWQADQDQPDSYLHLRERLGLR